jgi:phosphopantothenoylcysteine synthetase/decarboxylase
MKILITAGATREPIDEVRFLSNVSTGRTGARLAEKLTALGHAVTVLRGEGSVMPTGVAEVLTFASTEDLRRQLQVRLDSGGYDAVIQCAAVSDYRPAVSQPGKLSSYADGFALHLVPTPKLLPELKNYARGPLLVVGFKLTAGADAAGRREAVARLFASSTVDAVIHNDLRDLGAGDVRPFRAYRGGPDQAESVNGLDALATWLHALVSGSALAPESPNR